MSCFNLCKSTKVFEKIAVNIPLLPHLYSAFYKKAVENESKFANLSPSDNILFIGGGAIPYTALILAKKVNKVTVIDNDKTAVELGKKIVRNFKIKNISILFEQGESFDPKGHNVVFLPLQAQPKNKILTNLKLNCKDNTKILMRIPKSSFCKLYASIEDLPIKNYKEQSIQQLTYNKVIMFYPGDIKDE